MSSDDQHFVHASPAALAPVQPSSRRDSVDRVLDILSTMALANREWRPAELSRQLDMPKSTVLHVLKGLDRRHFVERTDSGSYRLAFAFYKVAVAGLGRYDFRALALKIMEDAVRRCGETVYLCLYHDREVLFFDRVDSPHPIQYQPQLAGSFWLHAGAAGKAILAHLDPGTLADVLRQPLRRVTENTIVDADRLREELDVTRRRGYAVSVGERVLGAAAVAAPVLTRESGVYGALVITIPSDRFDIEATASLGRIAHETAITLGDLVASSSGTLTQPPTDSR